MQSRHMGMSCPGLNRRREVIMYWQGEGRPALLPHGGRYRFNRSC